MLALVVLPIIAGAIAANGRPPRGAPSAFASFAPLVKETGYTAKRCAWTQGRLSASCALRGGGTCTFNVSSHTGSYINQHGTSGDESFIIWAESP